MNIIVRTIPLFRVHRCRNFIISLNFNSKMSKVKFHKSCQCLMEIKISFNLQIPSILIIPNKKSFMKREISRPKKVLSSKKLQFRKPFFPIQLASRLRVLTKNY